MKNPEIFLVNEATYEFNDFMDPFDPAFHQTAVTGWQPLLSLGLIACLGSFFFGALFTAVTRGIKEKGWFKFTRNENK